MERKLIAVAVASAMSLPMAADAVEGSFSGHVNATLVNENGSDATLGSGNGSETRFRFTGSEELDSGMTVAVTLEVGAGGNVHGYGGEDGKSDFRIRHSNVSLSSEGGGTVTIGQQGTASSGSSFADVGSTWIAGATNWCSYGGGGAACATNDASRGQVVRYDSPAIGPLSVAVSAGNDDFWDASAAISGSAGDTGYDLRLGYNGTDGSEDTIISGSVTMGSTGVAAAWSQGENSTGDNDYLYAKLDHSYGDGSVAVYYRRGEDSSGEGSLWGVGIAHSLGGGATAYAGYRVIDNDADIDDDVDLLIAGVRVTFN